MIARKGTKEPFPFWKGLFDVFQPSPRLTVSQWAERYRILPGDGSSEPGPWRNSRTPYLTEIMDALSASSRAREVVFCKGTQLGATEGGLNWLLYLIDHVGGPILAFQPTEQAAAEWSEQRVGPSIERCERLRGKVPSRKSRDSGNTILHKKFAGGHLFLAGTNTPNALAGKPIGNLYCDEIDRWPKNVAGEGNPVALAVRRASNWPRAKIFYTSTPVHLETSQIWKLYVASDQRVYEVPCPHCGHFQEIRFENLVWEKGNPESVKMVCAGCGNDIEEFHKTEMLAAGRWRAKNPGHKRVGFHLSALYSPIPWSPWADIVAQYEAAEGDPVAMQTVVNTLFGLPYKEDNETIAEDYLKRRREEYVAPIPEGVLAMTMAVDTQDDRLECEIVGWGEGEESWGIQYRIIMGDPSVLKSEDPDNPSVWQKLDDYRRSVFTHADGGPIRVHCTFVDSGGSYTDTVYRYTKLCNRRREMVYSVKGSSQPSRPLLNKPTRGGACQAILYVLGVDKGKEVVFNRLRIDKAGPGYCHFPSDENTGYDGRYYAGLISEQRREVVKDGRRTVKWVLPKKAHNEPFDLRVYSTAAIRLLNPNWARLKERRVAAVKPVVTATTAITPQPPPATAPRPPVSQRGVSGVKLIRV